MKQLVLASLAALTLLAGAARAAPKDVWTQINESAPRSDVLKDLRDMAPRSDGVFGDLQRNAP